MASPPSVCLGGISVCSLVVLLSIFLVFAYRVFYSRMCLSFSLRPVVGVVRFFPLLVFYRALASCCCSCRGGFLLRGWLCMLRCLCLFFCFALLQRKPERCSLVHAVLASSLVPSSCFLSICLFSNAGFCFLMHAHAWRRRALGLSLLSSYGAALVTQALRPGYCLPPVLPPRPLCPHG